MRHALSWAAVLLAAAGMPASSTGAPRGCRAVVVHVEDGDTVDVRIGGRAERVRYIGIDAPEIPHHGVGGAPGGAAARRLNEALAAGRQVRLELDQERRDRYGRLLAYVWVGRTMINLEMIRRGYARALSIPPNVRHAAWFARAQAEARAARRGLWADGGREFLPRPRIPSPSGRPGSAPSDAQTA
jgi:micrococcal nuclease